MGMYPGAPTETQKLEHIRNTNMTNLGKKILHMLRDSLGKKFI